MSAIVYRELHTTPANFVADVRAAVDASADWAVVPAYRESIGTISANYAAGVTAIATSAVETDYAYAIGSRLVLGAGTAAEEIVTIVNATSAFTVTATVNAHATGEAVHLLRENVLRAVTPAGSVLTLSLDGTTLYRGGATTWRTHDGVTTGTDPLIGFLVWHSARNSGSMTTPLHVTVAAGPDFLWLSVEGARPGEPGVESSGPYRSSLFIGTLVPYDDADTTEPVVVTMNTTDSKDHGPIVYVSRNATNTASWVLARLATITPPLYHGISGSDENLVVNSTRGTTRFFWPWVVIEKDDGPRGRLRRLFYAGPEGSEEITGMQWTYDGLTYVTTPVADVVTNTATPWVAALALSAARPLVLVPAAGTPA